MIHKTLKIKEYSYDQIIRILEENDILINHYAREYFTHPRFLTESLGELDIVIASLQEIGLENGGTLEDIFKHIREKGLRPCPPSTGVFLRLAWMDQPQSHDTMISGRHESPDQAVMVLSELLEEDDTFPKGLYLRKVEGRLWLRGYVCDQTYHFPGDALFVFTAE